MRFVLISGKRAAGKDHVANMVEEALHCKGMRVCRAALGTINKQCYAAYAGIDLERLQHDRAFKETHRLDMVAFHAERNKRDPEWALSEVLNSARGASADVLLLSDLRTKQDLAYFQAKAAGAASQGAMGPLSDPVVPPSRLVVLRVHAKDEARMERGFAPNEEKDTLHTEVDLDNLVGWTACVDNSDNTERGTRILQHWVQHTVVPRIFPPADDHGRLL